MGTHARAHGTHPPTHHIARGVLVSQHQRRVFRYFLPLPKPVVGASSMGGGKRNTCEDVLKRKGRNIHARRSQTRRIRSRVERLEPVAHTTPQAYTHTQSHANTHTRTSAQQTNSCTHTYTHTHSLTNPDMHTHHFGISVGISMSCVNCSTNSDSAGSMPPSLLARTRGVGDKCGFERGTAVHGRLDETNVTWGVVNRSVPTLTPHPAS